MAPNADPGGVGVQMHQDLSDRYIIAHRGTRVRKCHTSRRDAFKSINSNPLARYDLHTRQIEYFESPPRRRSDHSFSLKPDFDHHAYLLKFYTGIDPQIIDAAVKAGDSGIALKCTER